MGVGGGGGGKKKRERLGQPHDKQWPVVIDDAV